MLPSVQPAKKRPSCIQVCEGVVRNDVLYTRVLQAHLKVGEKEMVPSVQPAKERPPCIEVRKGIVKNDVLYTHVLQTHLKVGGTGNVAFSPIGKGLAIMHGIM